MIARPSQAATRRGNDYLSPRPTTPAPAKIRRWQPFKNAAGTMLGFISVELPSGIVINNSKLMIGPNGKLWIAPPSIKQTNSDGTSRVDANGKHVWSPLVEFRDRAASDRFCDIVLDALRRQHPEALDGGGA